MNLTLDVWNIIISLLENNRDKFCLLRVSTKMMKCQVSFDEIIDNEKIINSQWYHSFHNIVINSSSIDNSIDMAKLKIPSKTEHLTFRITDNRLSSQNKFTDSYFYETCGWSFNADDKEYIKKNILSTIKSINFSVRYTESILDISQSDYYLDNKFENSLISSNKYCPFVKYKDHSFMSLNKYAYIIFPLDDGKVSMYVGWVEEYDGSMKQYFYPHSENYLQYYSN